MEPVVQTLDPRLFSALGITSHRAGYAPRLIEGVVPVVVLPLADDTEIDEKDLAFCSGGVFGAGGAGTWTYAQVWNPLDSGVDVHVDQIFIRPLATGSVNFDIKHNAAAITNQDTLAFAAKRVGEPQSACHLRFQSTGTDLGTLITQLRVQDAGTAGDMFVYSPKQPFVVQPGRGLLIRPNTQNVSTFFSWELRERPRG